jgi:hypothetical protein
LQVIDRRKAGGVAGQNDHNVYLGDIMLVNLGLRRMGPLIGVNLDKNTPVILGRDFLAGIVLVYDGSNGTVTLCC